MRKNRRFSDYSNSKDICFISSGTSTAIINLANHGWHLPAETYLIEFNTFQQEQFQSFGKIEMSFSRCLSIKSFAIEQWTECVSSNQNQKGCIYLSIQLKSASISPTIGHCIPRPTIYSSALTIDMTVTIANYFSSLSGARGVDNTELKPLPFPFHSCSPSSSWPFPPPLRRPSRRWTPIRTRRPRVDICIHVVEMGTIIWSYCERAMMRKWIRTPWSVHAFNSNVKVDFFSRSLEKFMTLRAVRRQRRWESIW